jgi:NADPH:quinone reductase-like Zn-dependent oxidoreductase
VYQKHGPINAVLGLHEYQLPEVGASSVLLRVLAAPINPSDVNIIEGLLVNKARIRSSQCSTRSGLSAGTRE